MFNNMIEFFQSQCIKCSFLNSRTFNSTFYLFNLDSFHYPTSKLTFKHFF